MTVAQWATAAAVGIAAALSALPAVLKIIRYAGAAYLAYLGIRALIAAARRSGGEFTPPEPEPEPEPERGGRRAFRDGLLCNALNPKAAVFFVALWERVAGAGGSARAQRGALSPSAARPEPWVLRAAC
jgi:threonine/homoserine/homoserine lactone efflux protein